MRTTTTKIVAASGMALSMAAAGLLGPATAAADPATHQVTYTVTSDNNYDFNLFYLTAQPPSKAAYDTDAYSYVKNENVTLAGGVPWTFTTTLADPQWAILTVSSTARGTVGAPTARCEITVDGQVASQDQHPYSPRCQLGQW